MIFLLAFTAIVTLSHQGTVRYEDCLKEGFKHSGCWESKQLNKAGKFLCEKQGKSYDGKSCQ
jgi:hypothetical protein